MATLAKEVVCALGGHPGEVFGARDEDAFAAWTETYEPGSPDACPLKLDEESPTHAWGSVMALGERAVINELVKIGYHFREISRFATVESQPSAEVGGIGVNRIAAPGAAAKQRGARGSNGRGAYRRAFAFGLLKVLAQYREHVIRTERRMKSDGDSVLLTELQSDFCQYHVLLQRVHRVVCFVAQRDVRGCRLLRYVEDHSVCGTPSVERTMKVVVSYMYEVLYKQLGAWLVYGRLIDREGEFFIRTTASASASGAGGRERGLGKENGGPAAAEAEDALTVEEWHSGFVVDRESLPMHVSRESADTILFVGKSRRILVHARNNWKRFSCGGLDQGAGAASQLGTPGKEANCEALARLESLLRGGDFSRPAFDLVVDSLGKEAASQMWQLIVIHADLPKHLQALKDYYLTEKGNFHQVFLTEARSLMQKPPNPSTAEAEISTIFHQTAQRTESEADPLFANISIGMRNPEPESTSKAKAAGSDKDPKVHLPSCDEWDRMCMKYSVSWPLGLILTPRVLDKYHDMFQFLWRLRRVNVELDEVWTTLRRIAMRSRHHAHFSNSPQVWHLRHQMVHLVYNYQIYVQVDVIESQHAILRKHMESAENFLDLERALERFTGVLVTQSFLDITSITSMLNGIIKLCIKYAKTVQAQLESEAPLESLPLFARFQDDFQRRAGMLFTVLKSTKLTISSRAPHLHQFLARLNYNDWCAKLALDSSFANM